MHERERALPQLSGVIVRLDHVAHIPSPGNSGAQAAIFCLSSGCPSGVASKGANPSRGAASHEHGPTRAGMEDASAAALLHLPSPESAERRPRIPLFPSVGASASRSHGKTLPLRLAPPRPL